MQQKQSLWYKNAVFYEVSARAYYDSNGDGIGDLKGLTQKLDYIKHLGVDCIWLLPIFPSPLIDDGYDIADYYNVHPDLGTIDDFKELIDETHKRGMRIIADLVVNHTSDQCEWFKQAEADENSPYRDYYVWSDSNKLYSDARIIFVDTETSNWAWSEKAQKYYWHRFYSCQPDLNYDNPAVREEMKKIMRFWLDMGIDGFRADAVPYLIEREGTNCENLPETHAYLKELRQLIDKEYPDCILLAEANQWPQDLRPYFAEGNEFHMAFQFPLMPRIFKALAKSDCSPIIDILEMTPQIPETCQWCTFLRNHDELTLEMVTEEDRQFLWDFYAPVKRMRQNLGIRRRLAPLLDGNCQKIQLLYAVLFSLPGTPIIYYGDEIGMGDNIYLEDRDGVRTPMQWNSEKNAGFSNVMEEKLYLPVIKSDQFSYLRINVAAQQKDPSSLFNKIRKMLSVRKANPVMAVGAYEIINHPHYPALLFIKRTDERDTILALHNLSMSTIPIDLENHLQEGQILYDLMDEKILQEHSLELPPHSFIWLKTIRKK
ncbi:MAG: maltose alpha-D-glucosyltransferase [Anaerolineaceae bacterium]|jgi:maltose alpha-D-glucosyltransferase/alpha-amylase|nr:MAG: maltose alpha-D-glucosyltransferase [Anaerolineaceae bacterium]